MTEEEFEVEVESAEGSDDIRDTDIVFDCPHCGHNLAIDYRGAGLQINCVECGENVLVPIPDGMKIDDLDIEPGEILKQLFKTRRDLQKQEQRVAELQDQVHALVEKNAFLYARYEAFGMQVSELKTFCQQQAALRDKSAALLERMTADLAFADRTAKQTEDAQTDAS